MSNLEIEQFNATRNNLSLDDTEELLRILETLAPENSGRLLLEEFIARRGYNENPAAEIWQGLAAKNV